MFFVHRVITLDTRISLLLLLSVCLSDCLSLFLFLFLFLSLSLSFSLSLSLSLSHSLVVNVTLSIRLHSLFLLAIQKLPHFFSMPVRMIQRNLVLFAMKLLPCFSVEVSKYLCRKRYSRIRSCLRKKRKKCDKLFK